MSISIMDSVLSEFIVCLLVVRLLPLTMVQREKQKVTILRPRNSLNRLIELLRWKRLIVGDCFSGTDGFLKGGELLIDALPQVCQVLARPVLVTFAGDGPERRAWEHRARLVQARSQKLAIEFVGWVNEQRRDALLSESHLLVVPSVWPEPFGLVGPEAGLCGVPAAAFAVGGIHEWLSDGVNGYLAPADPPTSNGLADAITECLGSSETHARLRRGATDMAQRFNVKMHLTSLFRVFERVVHEPNKIAV